MNRTEITRCVGLAFLACLGLPGSHLFAAGYTFRGLGDLSGGSVWSAPFDISDDGSIVVGESTSSAGTVAFRWTAATGLVALGDLPGGEHRSFASGISADGSIIVGTGSPADADELTRPFIWTQATGLRSIDFGAPTEAHGVSADGSKIVGRSLFDGWDATLWTSAGGLVNLSDQVGESIAHAVSANGEVVVGTVNRSAFRWTASTGMVELGDPPGAWDTSSAHAVSADGGVIVGHATKSQRSQAILWQLEGGIQDLGVLSGGDSAQAKNVSADGSVVVGTANRSGALTTFFWTQETGMVDLKDMLLEGGATRVETWTLIETTGITPDGRTIIGIGQGPRGLEGWIATVPEPSTLGSAGAMLISLFAGWILSRVTRSTTGDAQTK